MFTEPTGVHLTDCGHGIDLVQDLEFSLLEFSLKQLQQPFFGPSHLLGYICPNAVLHVVRSQHDVSIRQPPNGRDVGRHEQRFEDDDVEVFSPHDPFDDALHAGHVKPTEVVAFSGDHMACGISEVEFGLGKDSFNSGVFDVRAIEQFRVEGVLVCVQTHHFDLVILRQQAHGQTVHGKATTIHGWARWFVTELQDAQRRCGHVRNRRSQMQGEVTSSRRNAAIDPPSMRDGT